jgi:SpoU rRNA methylase family enzyme
MLSWEEKSGVRLLFTDDIVDAFLTLKNNVYFLIETVFCS